MWELNFEKLGSALCELLTESVKKGILFFLSDRRGRWSQGPTLSFILIVILICLHISIKEIDKKIKQKLNRPFFMLSLSDFFYKPMFVYGLCQWDQFKRQIKI